MTDQNRSDQELAISALEKRKKNEKPSSEELAALKRVEREREEKHRWSYYESVPKKHYCEMSGRSAQVLNKQADIYNLPLRGKVINLRSLLKEFHNFLANNAPLLTQRDKGKVASSKDVTRLMLKDLEDFFRIPRKTWNDWFRRGLPRNADGTYNLYEVGPWVRERLGKPDKDEPTVKDQREALNLERDQFNFEKEKNLLITKDRAKELLIKLSAQQHEIYRQMLSVLPPDYADKLEKSTLSRMSHQFEDLEQMQLENVDEFEVVK